MTKARSSTIIATVVTAFTMACSQQPDVEKLPVGTDVQLTRKDGVVVSGKLAERDAERVKVSTGHSTKTVPRADVADVKVVEPGKTAALPAIAKFREYSVPAGTTLHLKMQTTVS